MNYRFEYCGNTDYCGLHVDKKISENFVPSYEPNELISMMKGTEGVEEITLHQYSISFKRGLAFTRERVLTSALGILKIWLEQNGHITPDEPLIQLPTYRQDIELNVKCPHCLELQKREDAEYERNWSSYDD